MPFIYYVYGTRSYVAFWIVLSESFSFGKISGSVSVKIYGFVFATMEMALQIILVHLRAAILNYIFIRRGKTNKDVRKSFDILTYSNFQSLLVQKN